MDSRRLIHHIFFFRDILTRNGLPSFLFFIDLDFQGDFLGLVKPFFNQLLDFRSVHTPHRGWDWITTVFPGTTVGDDASVGSHIYALRHDSRSTFHFSYFKHFLLLKGLTAVWTRDIVLCDILLSALTQHSNIHVFVFSSFILHSFAIHLSFVPGQQHQTCLGNGWEQRVLCSDR